ncbi:ADP-ribosylation factor-like [Oopsacas minuta]|uniref:ADP-ribosylation factor-like n=1 Tax=Oopsacas minuta TaxID=111878 RepID=A0AAV7JK89_9METZ|nr:ADP-ribosylation factor-like [Oopsacas minuta]
MSCFGLLECFNKEPKRVLILGLDGSGKTTLTYLLKYKELITTLPTVGFNIEELQIAKKLTVRLWDVGGHHKVRHLWTHFYMTTSGIIYMIDASTRERLKESKDEFYHVLKHPDVKENIPVLIFTNKIDIEGSLSINEIIEYFELKEFVTNPWCVQNCSTQTQEGVWKGIKIFSDMIKQNKHRT